MGLSLVSGLLLIVLMLSYGIVQIPINLFKHAFHKKKLRYLQYKVAYFDGLIFDK